LSSRADANTPVSAGRPMAVPAGAKLTPLPLTPMNGRPTTSVGPSTSQRARSPSGSDNRATTSNGNRPTTQASPSSRLNTSSSRQSLMSRSSSRRSINSSPSRTSFIGLQRRGSKSPSKKAPPRPVTPQAPPIPEPPPTIGQLLHPSIHAPRPPPSSSDSSPSDSPPLTPTSAGLNALLAQHAAAASGNVHPASPGSGTHHTNTASNNNSINHHHPLSPSASSSHITIATSPSTSSIISHSNIFPRPVSPGNLSIGGNPSSARRRSAGGGRVTLNVPGVNDDYAPLLGAGGMSTSGSIVSLNSTTSSIPLLSPEDDFYYSESKRLAEWEEWSSADLRRIRDKFTSRGLPFPEESVRKMLSPPDRDILLETEKKQLFPLIEQRLAEGDPTRYHQKRVRTMEVLTLPEIEPDQPELKWTGVPWMFRGVQRIRNPKRQALFKLDWQAMKLTDLLTTPQQEEELKRVIYPYFDVLRRAYLYQTSGSGQLGYMSQLQFHRFATTARIIDPLVTARFVDQLFVKINGGASGNDGNNPANTSGSKSVAGSPPATMSTTPGRRRSGRTLLASATGASPMPSRPTTAGKDKTGGASSPPPSIIVTGEEQVKFVEELSDDEKNNPKDDEKDVRTHNIV
jgi:hypothetical protein